MSKTMMNVSLLHSVAEHIADILSIDEDTAEQMLEEVVDSLYEGNLYAMAEDVARGTIMTSEGKAEAIDFLDSMAQQWVESTEVR